MHAMRDAQVALWDTVPASVLPSEPVQGAALAAETKWRLAVVR